MPSFAGTFTDDQLVQLVEYLRTFALDKPAWTNVHDEVTRSNTANAGG